MDYISQFIPQMFPLWIQQSGPNMVAFMQAYMEWLEQSPNPEYIASNLLNFRDIDNTLDEFLVYFQYEFMNSLPATIAANKRLLLKHIVNLYQSKGTKRGFALLFRILFNENIEVFLPGQYTFTTSGNQWIQPIYLEVSDSPYLAQLVGQSIYGLNTGATALVESYDVIAQNNKVINVLSISNVNGLFLYGDSILSADVPFGNEFAPLIVGSLSSVGIKNGGIGWNVGDLVNISGTGLSFATGALGRVSSTTARNGEVVFNLLYGGYGYTLNAVVQVLGGNGSGANFQVGSLVNEQIYQVNIDQIGNYYNTQLDIITEGFLLDLSGITGTFQVGENIIATSANSLQFDFTYVVSNGLSTAESLANGTTSVNIGTLNNPDFITVMGNQANLQAIVGNMIMVSNITSSIIYVNSLMTPIQVNSTNGEVTAANTSSITVTGVNNYFLTSANVVGQTSGATGQVTTVIRDTNWDFPAAAITNMDTTLANLLTLENLTIGTIASLAAVDPGSGYGSNPTVVVEEPLIAELVIPDGLGGIWGLDANVSAEALFANGIATSVQVLVSSYGFEPGDSLAMSAANNNSSIIGTAIVDSYGLGQGYWTSNASFSSDVMNLQDSYYYQPFSYEIRSKIPISQWSDTVNKLMHPVGYQAFGKFAVRDTQAIAANLVFEELQVFNSGSLVLTES